jgi:hypothetical protein
VSLTEALSLIYGGMMTFSAVPFGVFCPNQASAFNLAWLNGPDLEFGVSESCFQCDWSATITYSEQEKLLRLCFQT